MRCIPSHLAVPRPVFRGLRRDEEHLNKTNAPCETCSAETRFQGIATIVRLVRLIVRLVRLQCRDPFSGDCDFEVNRDDQPGLIMISCSAETRFQGIATVFLGGGTIPPSHFLSPCSAETRFQGIATLPSSRGAEGWLRFSLLAVPRPVFRGLRLHLFGFYDDVQRILRVLQCRDPFSGDCDGDVPRE